MASEPKKRSLSLSLYNALHEPTNLCQGGPISASPSPTNDQSAESEDVDGSRITYTDQTRLRNLNDDCLQLLFDDLSLWDIVRLTESSSQLLEFAIENAVFEKHASYGYLPDAETDMSFALFDKLMRHLGPHLTTLRLHEDNVVGLDLAQCIESVLDHSPQLLRLRLHYLHLPQLGEQQFGQHCDKLIELGLMNCVHTDCRWLWSFLDRATSLEVLALHDRIFQRGDRHVPEKLFKCPKLHTLSMCCSMGNSDLLLDVVRAHRATLRHVYFYFFRCHDYSEYYEQLSIALPDLEGMMVVSDFDEFGLESLSKMRNLRKIILQTGDKTSLAWLKGLASGPNVVEHLVLVRLNLTSEVCNIVGAFGAKLHSLELYFSIAEDGDAIQRLGAKMRHLRLLKISDGYTMVNQLAPAVALASAELETIRFRGVWLGLDGKTVHATLAALRKAKGGANKRPVFFDWNGEFEVDSPITKYTLMRANADIVCSSDPEPYSDPPPEEYNYYMQRFAYKM